MSWKFPIYRLENGEVIDAEDLNENFIELATEVSGNLNEHNFGGGFLDRVNYEAGVGLKIHHVFNLQDPDVSVLTSEHLVRIDGTWEPITSLTKTFTVDSEKLLWILTSFQYRDRQGAAAGVEYFSTGCFFCIQLDGQLLAESLIGSAEKDQEPIDKPTPSFDDIWTPGFMGGPTFITAGAMPEKGWLPATLEALVPVATGEHTVRVLVCSMGEADQGHDLTREGITNRELIVVEM